jgi:cellulose synthase/poly-beta-1,6-N-acetylglucosamine synthase-like glycosyltransferase
MMFLGVLYTALMSVLTVYALHRYVLLFLWVRHSGVKPCAGAVDTWPMVTVQLPFFNEPSVVRRLAEAALAMDYPSDKIEFQLLDDSTDVTTELAAGIAADARARGFQVVHWHRNDRNGFKAGALQEGLRTARGEFVTVFDADFVPRRNFLKTLIPYFTDSKVGMVQATWEHLNYRVSVLTRLQEVLTVSHFALDQSARFRAGRFFNFNGTCGIWRRTAIDNAGGWEGDTLAEDLDLSFRAQMMGWKFIYVDQVLADAELPADMPTFKRQQERWIRGTVQVARKLLIPVLIHPGLIWKVKAEAFLQLTNSIVYPLGLLAAGVILPSIVWRFLAPARHASLWDLVVFLALVSVAFIYHFLGQWVRFRWRAVRNLGSVCAAVVVPMGLSARLSMAVFKGLAGRPAVFVRTPKSGTVLNGQPNIHRPVFSVKTAVFTGVEILLCAYFGFSAAFACQHHFNANAFILSLFALGFGYVSAATIDPLWRAVTQGSAPRPAG